VGVPLLLIKDRKEKVALLREWSLEFGNPCLVLVLLKDFLFKSEQVPLRGHVGTVKNAAVRTSLPLRYNTINARERLEHRGSEIRETPSDSLKLCIPKLSLNSWLLSKQMFLPGCFSKMESLRVRQSWNLSERCEESL